LIVVLCILPVDSSCSIVSVSLLLLSSISIDKIIVITIMIPTAFLL